MESAPKHGTPLKSASDSAAEIFNLFDFEALARQRIPHPAYEYIAGGAADEITLRWNREAFDALALCPRVLVDIERIDTSVELFGRKLAFPVLLAPTAFHRLVHPDGEVETARGVSAGEALFVVSSLSTRRVEDISRAMTQPWCFQLFDIGRRRREFLMGLTVHGFPGYQRSEKLPSVLDILDGRLPANTARIEVNIIPGTQVRYSGGGITVAQQLVVDVLREPFPRIMRQLILAEPDQVQRRRTVITSVKRGIARRGDI